MKGKKGPIIPNNIFNAVIAIFLLLISTCLQFKGKHCSKIREEGFECLSFNGFIGLYSMASSFESLTDCRGEDKTFETDSILAYMHLRCIYIHWGLKCG